MLPSFIGIGAQKAGTTWLAKNLSDHPDIWMPERKELHFFDRLFDTPFMDVLPGTPGHDLEWYSSQFEPGNKKITGEITPAYSVLPEEGIRYVHKVMPSLKILFVMRNPIDRAWSHAKMNLARLGVQDFDKIAESRIRDILSHSACRLRGTYSNTLKNWGKYYGENQFHIDFFESIEEKPEEMLEATFRFLGVDANRAALTAKVREKIFAGVSLSVPDRWRAYLAEMYLEELEFLNDRFAGYATQWYESAKSVLSR